MRVYVNINDNRWKKYKIDFEKIARAANLKRIPNREVSITLTNDNEIQKLNREYRNIDRPTNVLSFELGDDLLLGDIYISIDTVIQESAAANISVAEHTAHLVVHGMLHLQGYDHIIDSDAKIMESKEVKILKKMGIKNPYIDDSENALCARMCGIQRFVFDKLRTHRIWQYVLYFLCGAIASFGFAPFYLWFATIGAIGVAYWMTSYNADRHRVGFWRTFVHVFPFGAAYAATMFWWVLHSIYVVPELAEQFAIWTVPGILGIALAGGIIFGVPFVVVGRVRCGVAARPVLFAAVWTVVLWMREWVLTGFPWNPIANITFNWPMLSNSMATIGALGLTFVIIGLVGSVVEFLRNRKSRMCIVSGVLFILMFVMAIISGYININTINKSTNTSGPIIRIVQPAKSQNEKIAYSHDDAVRIAEDSLGELYRLGNMSGSPDLIVYPETTYPFVVTDLHMPLARALARPTIIGARTFAMGDIYNAMVISDASGNITDIYTKSHLVPFGEYSPLGFMPSPADLSRGDGATVVTTNIGDKSFSFSPAICYEIIFSGAVVPRGANPDAVINITNDTWFGTTPGVYQHMDMVRRYAIESGLPIVRANYSGISAFVIPNGDISSSLPVGDMGVMDGVVWGAHKTVYRRIGRDGTMIIILLIACAMMYALHQPKTRHQ